MVCDVNPWLLVNVYGLGDPIPKIEEITLEIMASKLWWHSGCSISHNTCKKMNLPSINNHNNLGFICLELIFLFLGLEFILGKENFHLLPMAPNYILKLGIAHWGLMLSLSSFWLCECVGI